MSAGLGRIRLAWLLVMAAWAGLWLATAPWVGLVPEVFSLRPALLQATGLLALGAMSAALVLATRPPLLDRWLDGLDKGYRLHKWLGVTALVLAVLHWGGVELPKWAAAQGWLVRPPRPPATEPANAVLRQLQAWRGAAEGVGEWAFYALLLLVVLALWRRVPYRRFFQAHRLLPLVFLALVFHAVVLLQPGSWSQPLGAVLVLSLAGGTVAAVRLGLGRAGRGRQAVGEVVAVTRHPSTDVLEVAVRLNSAPRRRQKPAAAPRGGESTRERPFVDSRAAGPATRPGSSPSCASTPPRAPTRSPSPRPGWATGAWCS